MRDALRRQRYRKYANGGGKIPDMRGGQDVVKRSLQRYTAQHGSKDIKFILNFELGGGVNIALF
jgi:hypothetical protein